MKYTLPKSYRNAGLQVNIPDTTLKQYRSELGSTKAAVDKWLFENGYMAKAEYEASVEKAEAKKPVKREFKVDTTKASIIDFIVAALVNYKETMDSEIDITDVEVLNRNRLIAFSLGNEKYELTLVRKKQPK